MAEITEFNTPADSTAAPDTTPPLNPQPKLSRADQARLNGAKSRGPKSPAGKGRACMNAIKHGRYAKLVPPLEIEDHLVYPEFERHYIERFQPVDPVEHRLVSDLAAIDWRLTRCVAIETRILDLEIRRGASATTFEDFSLSRLATAVQKLAKQSPVLDSLTRRESALIRSRQIVLDTLIKLRQHQPRPERTQIPNDYLYLDPETIPVSNPVSPEANPITNQNEPAAPAAKPLAA